VWISSAAWRGGCAGIAVTANLLWQIFSKSLQSILFNDSGGKGQKLKVAVEQQRLEKRGVRNIWLTQIEH